MFVNNDLMINVKFYIFIMHFSNDARTVNVKKSLFIKGVICGNVTYLTVTGGEKQMIVTVQTSPELQQYAQTLALQEFKC